MEFNIYIDDPEVDRLVDEEYKFLSLSKKKNFSNILKNINNSIQKLEERIEKSKTHEYREQDYVLSFKEYIQILLREMFNLPFNKYNVEYIKIIFKKIIKIMVLCSTNDVEYDKDELFNLYQNFIYENINFLTKDDNMKKLKKIKGFKLFDETEITKDFYYISRIFPKYDKSTYKTYIGDYLKYMTAKYCPTDPDRVLNTLILVSNQNIDFKYFKTYFKLLIKKVKSIYKPYGYLLNKLILNNSRKEFYEYIYNQYENYIVSLTKQSVPLCYHKIYMELVDCICSAINNVNTQLMENLYGLILKYLPNEIEDNMYILMMSNWKYSTTSNKKILLKIYEFINKDSKIDPRCFFRGGKKDIYTLNILINEGRIEKDIQKVLLEDSFSLPNLIRYTHLYKGKNIKKLIRNEFIYKTYSNNKLKRMFRKLKKIFQNDKYLENQFRYVLNKKSFIGEFLDWDMFEQNIEELSHYKNFINMCNIFYSGLNMVDKYVKNIVHTVDTDSLFLYNLTFNNPSEKLQRKIIQEVSQHCRKYSDDTRKDKLFEIINYLDPCGSYSDYIYNNNKNSYKIDNKILNLLGYSNLYSETELIREIILKFPFITTIDEYYLSMVKDNLKQKDCLVCFENELCYTFKCHDTHSVCENCFPKMIKKECPMCRKNMGFVV